MRIAFAILFVLAGISSVFAQGAYPNKTVRMIVPYPAGGAVDVQARIISDKLSARWSQPVVVENRPGAGGNIGADLVYRAAPDGYTLMTTAPGPLAVNQHLYKELAFDPSKFVPVSLLSTIPTGLDIRTTLPVKSVSELIDYARKNPGKVTYASQGNGTTSHLTAAMLEMMGKIQMTHVTYTGTSPALTDLMGGRVDIFFDNLAVSVKQHEAGTLKILAVATSKRLPSLPNVPTMIESGLPGFLSATWVAVSAPPETPAALVQQISAVIADGLKMQDVREKFAAQAAEPATGAPAELATHIREERERWGTVIRAANVKLN